MSEKTTNGMDEAMINLSREALAKCYAEAPSFVLDLFASIATVDFPMDADDIIGDRHFDGDGDPLVFAETALNAAAYLGMVEAKEHDGGEHGHEECHWIEYFIHDDLRGQVVLDGIRLWVESRLPVTQPVITEDQKTIAYLRGEVQRLSVIVERAKVHVNTLREDIESTVGVLNGGRES